MPLKSPSQCELSEFFPVCVGTPSKSCTNQSLLLMSRNSLGIPTTIHCSLSFLSATMTRSLVPTFSSCSPPKDLSPAAPASSSSSSPSPSEGCMRRRGTGRPAPTTVASSSSSCPCQPSVEECTCPRHDEVCVVVCVRSAIWGKIPTEERQGAVDTART